MTSSQLEDLLYKSYAIQQENPTVAIRIAEMILQFDPDHKLARQFVAHTAERYFLYSKRRLLNHAISDLAVSSDGNWLLAGLVNGNAFLWNNDWSAQFLLPSYDGRTSCVAISPGIPRFYTGDSRGSIRCWNEQGELKLVMKGHEEEVTAIAFSADGEQMMSCGKDKVALLWDVEGNILWDVASVLGGDRYSNFGEIRTVAISPDGKQYLIPEDDTIYLYDASRKREKEIRQYYQITSSDFSPDGKHFIVGGNDGKGRVFDSRGYWRRTLEGHEDMIHSVCFVANHLAATTSKDHTVRVWDTKSFYQVDTFSGHDDEVLKAVASGNELYLYSASKDKTVKKWPLSENTTRELFEIGPYLSKFRVSPDKQWFLGSTIDEIIYLWDRNGNLKFSVPSPRESQFGTINHIDFSPDSKYFYTELSDWVCIWDIDGNQLALMNEHPHHIHCMAFMHTQPYLLTGDEGKSIRKWDYKGNLIEVIENLSGAVWYMTISPDDKYIVIGYRTTEVEIRDMDFNLVGHLEDPIKFMDQLSFTPDGVHIIASMFDKEVAVWDISGKLIYQWKDPLSRIQTFAMTEDLQYMFSFDKKEEVIYIWDRSGKKFQALPKLPFRVIRLAMDRNGKDLLILAEKAVYRHIFAPPEPLGFLDSDRIPRLTRYQMHELNLEAYVDAHLQQDLREQYEYLYFLNQLILKYRSSDAILTQGYLFEAKKLATSLLQEQPQGLDLALIINIWIQCVDHHDRLDQEEEMLNDLDTALKLIPSPEIYHREYSHILTRHFHAYLLTDLTEKWKNLLDQESIIPAFLLRIWTLGSNLKNKKDHPAHQELPKAEKELIHRAKEISDPETLAALLLLFADTYDYSGNDYAYYSLIDPESINLIYEVYDVADKLFQPAIVPFDETEKERIYLRLAQHLILNREYGKALDAANDGLDEILQIDMPDEGYEYNFEALYAIKYVAYTQLNQHNRATRTRKNRNNNDLFDKIVRNILKLLDDTEVDTSSKVST